MAWEGMRRYKRNAFGEMVLEEHPAPLVPSEARRKAQADHQYIKELRAQIDTDNKEKKIRIAKMLDQIKTTNSRPELIKIAAQDHDADIREAALLRLEEIPK